MAEYPLPVFHFRVEWGGTNLGFAEVSGLMTETQVIEYRDGASKEYSPLKMPGMKKYGNVTLKRGVFKKDNEFFEWANSANLNTVERRDMSVSLLDEEHNPVMTWQIKGAWPVKVEGPGLKGTGNEVAIESIELAHEGITVSNG